MTSKPKISSLRGVSTCALKDASGLVTKAYHIPFRIQTRAARDSPYTFSLYASAWMDFVESVRPSTGSSALITSSTLYASAVNPSLESDVSSFPALRYVSSYTSSPRD